MSKRKRHNPEFKAQVAVADMQSLPPFDVTSEPSNSSFKRRSKSGCKSPKSVSPAGSAIHPPLIAFIYLINIYESAPTREYR